MWLVFVGNRKTWVEIYVGDRIARACVGFAFLRGRGTNPMKSRFQYILKYVSSGGVFFFRRQNRKFLPLDQRMRKSPMLNTMAPATAGAGTK